jgi:hypothetical protein
MGTSKNHLCLREVGVFLIMENERFVREDKQLIVRDERLDINFN